MLRIKVFVDHLCKITVTVNRRLFMTLSDTDCSKTLAKQTNVRLNSMS